MNRQLPERSISIGYNPKHGQKFFDLISAYDKYIKEYFFGVSHGLDGSTMDTVKEFKELSKIDTYGYPANLLVNNVGECMHLWDLIEQAKNIVNLKGITLIEPEYGPLIKERYPELEINVSVRFWDRNKFPHSLYRLDWLQKQCMAEVINVSGAYHYNDHVLMKEIQDRGMKVKIIVNEECLINRSFNYTELPGCIQYECCPNVVNRWVCFSECINVLKQHPWMMFSDVTLYKEQLDYYSIDVFKISGRTRSLEILTRLLNYWTNDDKTTIMLNNRFYIDVSGSDRYQVFCEYAKYRSTKCNGHCASCGVCKHVYEELFLKNPY